MTLTDLKRPILVLSLVFATQITFAQGKQGNIWYFGDFAGLDFNVNPPVPLIDGQMSTHEGCASISDENGQLLFYTDGIRVWNADHEQMPNGFGMTGDSSSSQSGVIVPKPGDSNIYYIFTVAARVGRLDYSIVDMQLNGGLGDVISKNIPLLTLSTEKISAALHQNKKDIWVLGHEYFSDKFYAWLVTDQGVSTSPVISGSGSVHTGAGSEVIGYLKFDPNNSKVAVAGYRNLDFVEVFDFDNQTGRLTFESKYTGFDPRGPYGIEFSPNGELLYISERLGSTSLYQVKVGTPSGPISTAGIKLFTDDDFGALQLAPNGKIYMARDFREYLGVIHNPNQEGQGANFQLDGIHLGGQFSGIGLPTFIQSFFKPIDFQTTLLCLNDQTEFNILSSQIDEIDSVIWDFGDPASGLFNRSEELSPKHIFTNPGNYQVSLTAYFDTLAFDQSQLITIQPLPEINLGRDTILVQNQNLPISLPDSLSYSWLDGLVQPDRTITSPGWYWATATNANSCMNLDSMAVFNISYSDTCLLNNTLFTVSAGNIDLDSVAWDFGDNLTASTIDHHETAHTFASAGAYNVSVTLYYKEKSIQSIFPITISRLPDTALPKEIVLVQDEKRTLNVTSGLDVRWDDNSTQTSRTFNSPGWHWVDASNANSCSVRDSLAVFSLSYADTCFSSTTHIQLEAGNIQVDSVKWNFGNSSTGNNNLGTGQAVTHEFSQNGDFTVSADIYYEGKTIQADFSLQIAALPDFDLGPDQTLFYEETLTLSAAGSGSAYLWQDGSTDGTFLVEDPGWYWVEVTNAAGCQRRDSVEINYDQIIDVGLPADTILCLGERLSLDVSLADAGYLWQDGSTSAQFEVTTEGIYWVEITNAFGNRTQRDSIEVSYYEFGELEVEAQVVICEAQTVTLTASGGQGQERYRWYDGNMQLITENSGTLVTPQLSATTDYFVTLTNSICETEPLRISVIYDQVTARIEPSDTIVTIGDPIQLDGYGGTYYSWSPPLWLDRTDQPTVIAHPENDLEYLLTVYGTYGCKAVDSVDIYVEKAIYIPNAISPNGDGKNDTWEIINLDRFPNNTIQIFNRWGTPVYRFHQYHNQWDGTINGEDLPGNTFTYLIDFGDPDMSPRRGTVKIVR